MRKVLFASLVAATVFILGTPRPAAACGDEEPQEVETPNVMTAEVDDDAHMLDLTLRIESRFDDLDDEQQVATDDGAVQDDDDADAGDGVDVAASDGDDDGA
jgi:hypothetical protein